MRPETTTLVAVSPEAEADIRRLAGEVRRQWRRMDGNAWSPDAPAAYRAAKALLTAALLAHPAPVRLDDRTVLLPNADGDGPAFVPDPERCGVGHRAGWRRMLDVLIAAHKRRHAGRSA